MVNFNSLCSSINGAVFLEKSAITNDINIVFNRKTMVEMTINGKNITSLKEWFGAQTIVSYSPDDIEILHGNPSHRRRFLDILISFFDREYLQALIEYRKNLSLRNFLLKTHMDEILCEIYEEKMAESGAIILKKRADTLLEIKEYFIQIYQEISAQKDVVNFEYIPSFSSDLSSIKSWKEVFYRTLGERRKKDREMGFSSKGPHRDDVHFFINKMPAVNFASRGQSRSIVLSLKTSAIVCIEKHTGEKPVILFDDAVSELDTERTERIISLIEKKGQIFIACPRKTVPANENFMRYFVSGGTLVTQ
jgi:DNA replication and repair protein RecF